MLLNISTSHYPATDLGYLLHKHPDKFQSFDLSVGKAHVFYPEAGESKTTISLLLDIDPIDMVREARNLGGDAFPLGQFVNDRPYVASSFMSVAIAKIFSSALNGNCKEKPELVEKKLPFEVSVSVQPAPHGGEILIRKFYEPLGYNVNLKRCTLDDHFPEWGDSKYFQLSLANTLSTKDLLSHLYVLIPALDNNKHYFVNENEIEKLLKKGEGWLNGHPAKQEIARRYLHNIRSLSGQAMQLLTDGDTPDNTLPDKDLHPAGARSKKETLHDTRLRTVVDRLLASGAKTVLDLGCGDGKLLRLLAPQRQFSQIVGMDVAYKELLKAKERLGYDEMPPHQQERIRLFQGSLTYRDKRIEGFQAAAVIEVIEHLDPDRLKTFETVLFAHARPATVLITTPNKEYNMVWENLDTGTMRHSDHRFEWSREEFARWASHIATSYPYNFEIVPIGPEVENVGAPTQMAIFKYGN